MAWGWWSAIVPARKARRPRIVLDTNLFIAAYWRPRSVPARILETCRRGEYVAVWSEELRREVENILTRIRVRRAFCDKVAAVFAAGRQVTPRRRVRALTADPSDNMLLECAQTGRAGFVITSDRAVLALATYGQTAIVMPSVFWTQHRKQR